VHDFVDDELGKVVPYGVYDIAANAGCVSVGIDNGAAALAFAAAELGLTGSASAQTKSTSLPAARAIGRDLKGKLSPLLYIAGIALAFVDTRLSDAIYVAVALMWLRPDPRIERALRMKAPRMVKLLPGASHDCRRRDAICSITFCPF